MDSIRQIVVRKNSCRLSVVGWKFGSLEVWELSESRITRIARILRIFVYLRFWSGERGYEYYGLRTQTGKFAVQKSRESEFPPTVFDILQVCRCADLQDCKCASAGRDFQEWGTCDESHDYKQERIERGRESEFPPTGSDRRSAVSCQKDRSQVSRLWYRF